MNYHISPLGKKINAEINKIIPYLNKKYNMDITGFCQGNGVSYANRKKMEHGDYENCFHSDASGLSIYNESLKTDSKLLKIKKENLPLKEYYVAFTGRKIKTNETTLYCLGMKKYSIKECIEEVKKEYDSFSLININHTNYNLDATKIRRKQCHIS